MKKISLLSFMFALVAVFMAGQAQASEIIWADGGAWMTYGESYYCHVTDIRQYNRLRAHGINDRGHFPRRPPKLIFSGECSG